MSIGKQQIIHIVSEVVIITGISIYFQLKIRNLHNTIERLENKIEQQEQVIQNHEQLLLRIMNNLDSVNTSMPEMKKSWDDKKPPTYSKSTSTPKLNKVKKKHLIIRQQHLRVLDNQYQKNQRQTSLYYNNYLKPQKLTLKLLGILTLIIGYKYQQVDKFMLIIEK